MQMIVGGKKFRTKKACMEYTRDVIKTTGVSYVTSGDVFTYLLSLLNNHPESKRKIGTGVIGFNIKKNVRDGGKTFTLYLVRSDDSVESFSWRSCIIKIKCNKLYNSLRHSIQPQIDEYRYNHEGICVICGSTDSPQVDHKAPPFRDISQSFLITEKKHPILFDKERETSCDMFREIDAPFAERWQKYHAASASLQILCAKCNIAKG